MQQNGWSLTDKNDRWIVLDGDRGWGGLRFFHRRHQAIQRHDDLMIGRQKTPHQLIHLRLFFRSHGRKRDLRNLKIVEKDVAIVHADIGLGLQDHDPDDFLLPLGGKGKGHPEIQLFEILPAIDLRLVIDQASLLVGPMPRPTRIGRDALVVRLGRLRQEWAGRQGGEGQNKREDGFHRVSSGDLSDLRGRRPARLVLIDEMRADLLASAWQPSVEARVSESVRSRILDLGPMPRSRQDFQSESFPGKFVDMFFRTLIVTSYFAHRRAGRGRFFELRCAPLHADRRSYQSQSLGPPW